MGDNLFLVRYGDLDKSEADILEMTDVVSLSHALGDYVRELAGACGAEVVVLDCHGGPDKTSFASCLAAEHTLLVSEPDRITLHGTLHFLRMLERMTGTREIDIRLVFNKVIPAFSVPFLFSFYRQYLKPELRGTPLLGIFPFEAHLTKAFEKTPLLTTIYPTSQLARKTRLVLYDLLVANSKELLSPAISSLSAVTRARYRYLMGRIPRVVNPDFILRVTAICSLLGFGFRRFSISQAIAITFACGISQHRILSYSCISSFGWRSPSSSIGGRSLTYDLPMLCAHAHSGLPQSTILCSRRSGRSR